MIQRRVKMLDSANRRMLWREAIRRATETGPVTLRWWQRAWLLMRRWA